MRMHMVGVVLLAAAACSAAVCLAGWVITVSNVHVHDSFGCRSHQDYLCVGVPRKSEVDAAEDPSRLLTTTVQQPNYSGCKGKKYQGPTAFILTSKVDPKIRFPLFQVPYSKTSARENTGIQYLRRILIFFTELL